MRRARILAVVALSIALLAGGCAKKSEPKLQPKIKPPAIAEEGLLRVGVDFSVPPFAGKQGTKEAGIDIDVAAAIADKLGLHVEYVDVKPSEAASALAEGEVDAVMSVPLAGADLSAVSAAGIYITDAPAIFASGGSKDATVTLDTLPAGKIALQEKSESFWVLEPEVDAKRLAVLPSLRDAFKSVESGESSAVAGDALVGAYIARDFAPIAFAGQIGEGTPLAVVVSAENTELAEAIMQTLDVLAADGVLDSIRSKWVGDLPAITVAEEAGSK